MTASHPSQRDLGHRSFLRAVGISWIARFNERARRLRAIIESARPHISRLVAEVTATRVGAPLLIRTQLVERHERRTDLLTVLGLRVDLLKPDHQRDIFGTQFLARGPGAARMGPNCR